MLYKITTLPPSVNSMYGVVRGGGVKDRYKTPEYTAWIREATKEISPVTPLKAEKYELHIHLPKTMRGDIDNRVKPISDLLVTTGATPDDKHMEKLVVTKTTESGVIIEVIGR